MTLQSLSIHLAENNQVDGIWNVGVVINMVMMLMLMVVVDGGS